MLRLPIENTSDKKGEIMAEWKNYTLEEVCERIYSGGTPSTKHEEYWNGDIKWLSSGETSQRFVYDTERKITQEGVENSSTKLATKGCTVIATAGQGYTRGQASFLMTDTYMNQSVIACKANENVILPLYLYYNLDSRYEEFRLLSDGTSTRGGLSGWILKRMEIKLPPKSSQKKIIDILYSIDRKIEENKAINLNFSPYYRWVFFCCGEIKCKQGVKNFEKHPNKTEIFLRIVEGLFYELVFVFKFTYALFFLKKVSLE